MLLHTFICNLKKINLCTNSDQMLSGNIFSLWLLERSSSHVAVITDMKFIFAILVGSFENSNATRVAGQLNL